MCHVEVINWEGQNLTLILQKDNHYLHGCIILEKLCNWKLLLPVQVYVTEEKYLDSLQVRVKILILVVFTLMIVS